MFKRTLLTLVISSILCTVSYANPESSVALEAEAMSFSVTVPTVLPIVVNNKNEPTYPDSVAIINNSVGPIKVESIDIIPKNNWVRVPYSMTSVTHPSTMPEFSTLNAKNFILEVMLRERDSIIDGRDGSELIYAGYIAPQTNGVQIQDIADVVITVGWHKDSVYTLATDSDFYGDRNGEFIYIGTAENVEIPNVIKGVPVTSYKGMFKESDAPGPTNRTLNVKSVKATNKNVTDASYMFKGMRGSKLDLNNLDISGVTTLKGMLSHTNISYIDVSSLNSSNVTDMSEFVKGSDSVYWIVFGDMNFSNVETMEECFEGTTALMDISLAGQYPLDKLVNTDNMFRGTGAGQCILSTDDYFDMFNNSLNKPSSLVISYVN